MLHRALPLQRLAPAIGLALALALAGRVAGQDSNIVLPIETVEQRLRADSFTIAQIQDTRFEGDRTQRAVLIFPDESAIMVKWARAARGASSFNNEPRYEIAAYELQKLFLESDELVVPPTIVRAFPLAWYRAAHEDAEPTFDEAESVLVVLQYWMNNVTDLDKPDEDRLKRDPAYARHFGNANTLTYMITHKDANAGNLLISRDSARPRVFSVDNGVAFRSDPSNRGEDWKWLKIDRISARTVERLRTITREQLEAELGVIAQWEVRDGQLVPVPPGENLDPGRGVRRKDGVVQLGLTRGEIADVYKRLERLLERVDDGKLEVF